MRRWSRTTWTAVAIASTLSLALGLALGAGSAVAVPRRQSPYHALGTFTRVLAHIENSYVESVDETRLVYGAIQGMVAGLDPHSDFLPPDDFRIFQSDTTGRFGGVGLEVDAGERTGGRLTVVTPIEGTPAARAGIQPGDVIVSIEGRSTQGMSIDAAVRLMRGEPGTRVRLELLRRGRDAPIPLTLERAIVRVESVTARLLEPRIVLLRVRQFQEGTIDAVRRELDRLTAESGGSLRGLVLDLRDNPGGLLDQAVALADEFIGEGVLLTTRGQGGRLLDEERARQRGTREGFPIVAVVNGASASAAEVVAGALQDSGRAVIVGTRTFGKGSVQTIIELPDGSGLKLTIARYYTPSGRSIQAQGIAPDVEVEGALGAAPATESHPRESDLPRHLPNDVVAAGPGRPSVPAATSPLGPPASIDDVQLRMAYQHLRAMILTAARRSR